MSAIIQIIKHDVKLAFRRGGGVFNMLAFYVIASTLFVFGIGSEPKDTAIIAPSVIWVCALLAQVFSINRIFSDDYEDGTLAQLILQGDLTEKIVIARIISNWVTGGLLLAIISPCIGILFGLEGKYIKMLLISLLCGTPLLSFITVAGAGLTLGISRAGAILAILIFPLYIPVLIFGASWIAAEDSFAKNMGLLVAMSLFLLPVSILAAAASIKAAFEEG